MSLTLKYKFKILEVLTRGDTFFLIMDEGKKIQSLKLEMMYLQLKFHIANFI